MDARSSNFLCSTCTRVIKETLGSLLFENFLHLSANMHVTRSVVSQPNRSDGSLGVLRKRNEVCENSDERRSHPLCTGTYEKVQLLSVILKFKS